MAKYTITLRTEHIFTLDTSAYHDAEEGPPPSENFHPDDVDSVGDWIAENLNDVIDSEHLKCDNMNTELIKIEPIK